MHIFSSAEGMDTNFESKANFDIVRNMVRHFIENSAIRSIYGVMINSSKSVDIITNMKVIYSDIKRENCNCFNTILQIVN